MPVIKKKVALSFKTANTKKTQPQINILICMLKTSDVHDFVFINDNLSIETLLFEETINKMTFIEHLTWNTTVFSLNVKDNFRGEGWGWLHYYIITATYNKSVITATLRWLCNNQKRKTKDDLWIFYDRRKGMSYHHAKNTVGQTTMCFLLLFHTE